MPCLACILLQSALLRFQVHMPWLSSSARNNNNKNQTNNNNNNNKNDNNINNSNNINNNNHAFRAAAYSSCLAVAVPTIKSANNNNRPPSPAMLSVQHTAFCGLFTEVIHAHTMRVSMFLLSQQQMSKISLLLNLRLTCVWSCSLITKILSTVVNIWQCASTAGECDIPFYKRYQMPSEFLKLLYSFDVVLSTTWCGALSWITLVDLNNSPSS